MNNLGIILPVLFTFGVLFQGEGRSFAAPNQPPLPQSAAVSGFVGKAQTYPLSCESRSAADVAAFWGVNVDEKDIFHNLPSSDDPTLGFVGDVNGKWGNIPPGDYGVHAPPIAAVLRQYGLDAQALSGMAYEELQAELALGRPVIVWVVGIVWNGIPQQILTSQGNWVTVAAFEHTMVATAYTPQTITLVNSGDGTSDEYALSDFLASWGVLNNMAVVVKGKLGDLQPENNPIPPTSVATPTPTQPMQTAAATLSPQTLIWQYFVQDGDTLSALAEKWNIPLAELAAYNQLSPPYHLLRGQVLFVPLAVVRLSSPQTPSAGVSPFFTSPLTPVPNQTPSSTQTRFYTVQRGDYLTKLAREWGTSWQEIAQLNRLSYPYQIYPGQVLQIP